METGFVEEALVLLRRAGSMDLLNQEALSVMHLARRAAQGVAAAMLVCSPPHSPGRVETSERSGLVKPGEPVPARIPWHEDQAEPSAAGRCTSTGGQKKRILTADAHEGWCGSTGLNPDADATLWEQRPGSSRLQLGEAVRRAGVEPTREFYPQGTRAAVVQGGDPGCEEASVLDFDEGSVEEGELVDEGEEEDWWAQGGAGPASALSHSFQSARQVQLAFGRTLDGAHIGRRKAQE
ncbi:hypothetical protein NDU88_002760 [Pleurodeles waltl]|uniref:Uncharacterized protein n=1 Tax=Pleurodeles waltl TaxID=8319 RepID=A0AAV7SE32_PLEWA|nr:hypothetical protein NDU88_002760 [Pleurodeles waltl]